MKIARTVNVSLGPGKGPGLPTDRRVVVDYWEEWTGTEGQQVARRPVPKGEAPWGKRE